MARSSGSPCSGSSLVAEICAGSDLDVLLIDALMAPTRIYVKSLLPLVQAGRIHGLAHITGGGLLENIPRVLPDTCHATVDADAWPQPRC